MNKCACTGQYEYYKTHTRPTPILVKIYKQITIFIFISIKRIFTLPIVDIFCKYP